MTGLSRRLGGEPGMGVGRADDRVAGAGCRVVPGPLLAVLLATAAMAALGLERYGIGVVGAIPKDCRGRRHPTVTGRAGRAGHAGQGPGSLQDHNY
jgi:hypothetical protein